MQYSLLSLGLALAVAVGAVALRPRMAERRSAAVAERLLAALARADYDAFVADADRGVRQLSREDFLAFARQQGPRLQHDRGLTKIADYWRGSYRMTQWRVTYADGTTETLTLGLRDNRVATFALH